MAYQLSEINERAKSDAKAFIDECDEVYAKKISQAADKIIGNMEYSQIVLLSGPSGSGKTTTSKKIEEELQHRGIRTYAIGMDDYFRSRDRYTPPMAEDGLPDLESPECVDMELLNEHFDMLQRGERVYVPKFDFARQMRILEPSKSLKLGKDEIAIFEGIHALNSAITTRHQLAFKLYISARSNVVEGNSLVFKGTWMRLMRRTVRDYLFRGMDAQTTLINWANVRTGEKKYISPFKDQADIMFDSSFPYEVGVLGSIACELFDAVPEGTARFDELCSVCPACERFESISVDLLNADSLLREFVGGGIYD